MTCNAVITILFKDVCVLITMKALSKGSPEKSRNAQSFGTARRVEFMTNVDVRKRLNRIEG